MGESNQDIVDMAFALKEMDAVFRLIFYIQLKAQSLEAWMI